MSQVLASSVRKQIVDLLISRLAGTNAPIPSQLGNVVISKNRSVPVGPSELPMYSVYFLNDQPTPVGGDRRRPVKVSRSLAIEVRVLVKGDDDSADPHCAWVTQQIISADRCIVNDVQLALGVIEAETIFSALEGSQGQVVEVKMRFGVEYTTNPTDITKVA